MMHAMSDRRALVREARIASADRRLSSGLLRSIVSIPRPVCCPWYRHRATVPVHSPPGDACAAAGAYAQPPRACTEHRTANNLDSSNERPAAAAARSNEQCGHGVRAGPAPWAPLALRRLAVACTAMHRQHRLYTASERRAFYAHRWDVYSGRPRKQRNVYK